MAVGARVNEETNRFKTFVFFWDRLEVSYGWSKTEITKRAFIHWGEGNRWQVDPIELKKQVPKDFNFPVRSDRIHLKWELSSLHGIVPTGPTSPRQSVAVWALSTTPNEAINREPQRVATGLTAAPTDTDHSTAYPGGRSSRKSRRSQAQFSHQLDRPSATRTKRSTQNTEEKLKTSIHRRRCPVRGV